MSPNNATRFKCKRKGIVPFKETIKQIQEYVDLPQDAIRDVLRGARAVVLKNIINGYSVRLMPGLTFQARYTPEHMKRLPDASEILVPAYYNVLCRISSVFYDQVVHAFSDKCKEAMESSEDIEVDFDWDEFPE